jgi:hypothetical protein
MKAQEPMDEADALLEDWARLFRQDLSDEAAAALSQFITTLASLVESRYGRQINRHRDHSQPHQEEPF